MSFSNPRVPNVPLDSGDRLLVDDSRGVRSVPVSEVSAAVPAATTTSAGVVELATVPEAVLGTDSTRAVTATGLAAAIAQPVANSQGAGYALAAADIGNVVFATGAGAQAFSLPDLSASLTAGRVLLLTIQCTGAATAVTITPGGSSQIDGAGVGVAFVGAVGRSRISLMSLDGLSWYSGTP